MNWEVATFWFSHERYEIRMIRPDLWIVFGPDGWADTDRSMRAVKDLADEHLKAHPAVPL